MYRRHMPGFLSDDGLVLAETVLDYFENNPLKHEQNTWWCNTGCCFAGGLALAVGAAPVKVYIDETEWTAALAVDKNGVTREIKNIGRDALGLPRDESGERVADVLFWSSNTLLDLREMITALASGHIPPHPGMDQ